MDVEVSGPTSVQTVPLPRSARPAPRPAGPSGGCLRVDLQDAVQAPREVEHDPFADGLPGEAGARATGQHPLKSLRYRGRSSPLQPPLPHLPDLAEIGPARRRHCDRVQHPRRAVVVQLLTTEHEGHRITASPADRVARVEEHPPHDRALRCPTGAGHRNPPAVPTIASSAAGPEEVGVHSGPAAARSGCPTRGVTQGHARVGRPGFCDRQA